MAIIVVGVWLGLSPATQPAWAHGGNESNQAYVLVQQALGHLAHDTGHDGMDLAMEKIDDALAAPDKRGVALGEVQQAKQALEAEQIATTRSLLQSSIQVALSELGPATGEQTGTTIVRPALAGRAGLTGRDWGFLAAGLILLLAGAGLAYRFRPSESVSDLRQHPGLATSDPHGVHRLHDSAGDESHVDDGP